MSSRERLSAIGFASQYRSTKYTNTRRPNWEEAPNSCGCRSTTWPASAPRSESNTLISFWVLFSLLFSVLLYRVNKNIIFHYIQVTTKETLSPRVWSLTEEVLLLIGERNGPVVWRDSRENNSTESVNPRQTCELLKNIRESHWFSCR